MNTLKTGDKAPDFNLLNQDGKSAGLNDYSGRKIVLYFYPKDSTPGCTAEACSLRDGYQELKSKGVEVLGVSADSIKSHQNFIEKQSLPFSLLSDPDRTTLKAYEAWGEKKMYGKSYEGIIRKSFIIDEKGFILHIIEKVDTKNHAEQILKLIS